MVKIKDIRAKSDEELNQSTHALRKESLNLRFSQATGQLKNTARRKAVRREIAQVKTVQSQRLVKKGAK